MLKNFFTFVTFWGAIVFLFFFSLCACAPKKPKLVEPEVPQNSPIMWCYAGSFLVKGAPRYGTACVDDELACEFSRKKAIEYTWFIELGGDVVVKEIGECLMDTTP